MRRRLIDAVSIAQPLTPAVSRGNDSYNTNSPSASVSGDRPASEIIRTRVRCRVYYPRLLLEGGVYFVQELRIVRLLFEADHYSRAASVRRNTYW